VRFHARTLSNARALTAALRFGLPAGATAYQDASFICSAGFVRRSPIPPKRRATTMQAMPNSAIAGSCRAKTVLQ
jgi:hypothetical protein